MLFYMGYSKDSHILCWIFESRWYYAILFLLEWTVNSRSNYWLIYKRVFTPPLISW